MSNANPRILDGKFLAEQIISGIAQEVNRTCSDGARRPGLAVLLVGENPASKAYVANKEKAARACGFQAFNLHLAADATFADVQRVIGDYNGNDAVDGILVQLPLPKHLSGDAAIDLLAPSKDADALHPANQGLLIRGQSGPRPCTPFGVLKLLDLAFSTDEQFAAKNWKDLPAVDLAGKRAIVIGRSILVGKPLGLMLLERNATVTMAHSRSPDLPALVHEADIVIAAVGVAGLVRGDWIRKGAVVIDVGINRLESGPRAGKLAGDVAYEEALVNASAITPVPGGVGPMTVAMLMHNTFSCYKRRIRQS